MTDRVSRWGLRAINAAIVLAVIGTTLEVCAYLVAPSLAPWCAGVLIAAVVLSLAGVAAALIVFR